MAVAINAQTIIPDRYALGCIRAGNEIEAQAIDAGELRGVYQNAP